MSTRSSLYKYIHEKWLTWNMFNSRSTDPTIKHQEILSTRLYFILIIISFSILTTYISISIQTKNTIIPFPTQSMYENLQKQYPNNLQCSCNKTVILYKTFVKIIPSFHQVCSSDFISQQWIDFIFQVDSTLIYPIDIRTSLSSMWQLIKSFCQSATMTIFDRINQFYNSFLIEPMLLTEQVLEAKVQTILYSLFQMTLSNFIQSIEIVYRITQVNQFITGLLTNYIAITKEFKPINIYYPEYTIGSMTISSYIGMIENEYIFKDSSITCSCKINRSCPLSGKLCRCIRDSACSINFKMYFRHHETNINWEVEGIQGGCSVLDSNAIDQFHYDTYINIQLISKSDFHNQIHNIILQFQNVTLIKFSRNFKLIRDILNGNAFISSHSLNWEWWRDLTRIFYTLPTRPIIMNDGCSCGTRSDCTESAGIYDEEYTNQEIFSIPGWNIGCSVIETVLYSSLECFFEQNCTELLLLHIAENNNENPRINVSIIDSSLKSRFPRNIRIENIIDQLFVEEWKIDTSYSSFYNQCAPISCTYQIERDNYFIYTASKILGLYGGLSLTLRFTIPIIIKIIFQIRNRCQRNTIIPTE
ncbi:hypothetical protein I4U23_011099 [Adineta vaga]|nr:hypothetical protein I4U23_011099 [Adineta vaga]